MFVMGRLDNSDFNKERIKLKIMNNTISQR